MRISLVLIILFSTFKALADPNSIDIIANSGPAKTINSSLYELEYSDIVYGKSDAPIQVLEYYSLVCKHCSVFYLDTFAKIKQEYIDTGKVRWIKRSLAAFPQAMKATLLLNCVSDEAKEKYLKLLLKKQESWSYQKDYLNVLYNMASLGGMSQANFQACINNKENERKIENIAKKAEEQANIKGTPTFYINCDILTTYSFLGFKEKFEKILKQSNH